jgi:hypothetical protein
MDFTFWESQSIKLPKGPLYASGGFLVAILILVFLGQWAGSLIQKKEVKFSGPTLVELQEMEKIVASGDIAKMDAMLQKEGNRIGADMYKWQMVAKWRDDALFGLYKDDLLFNLRGQIASLQKQLDAEKAKAAGTTAKPAAAEGGEAKAAPTKQ